MNLIEIMDFDISNILSFTTDECITFCRDVMKSFVKRFLHSTRFHTVPFLLSQRTYAAFFNCNAMLT